MVYRADPKQMFRFMAVFGKKFLFKKTLFIDFALKFLSQTPKKSLGANV